MERDGIIELLNECKQSTQTDYQTFGNKKQDYTGTYITLVELKSRIDQ